MSVDITDKSVIFRLSGTKLALFILPLPTVAFILCVGLSIIYDFERSTATHCKVRNYLPSISSAIGGFTPQRYIWRVCIALHASPRFLVAAMYYNYYSSFTVHKWRSLYYTLAAINSGLHVAEILALVGLTNVSSTENYSFHEHCFIFFVACSLFYMLLSCILFKWSHSDNTMTEKERKSLRLKWRLFLFNLTSLLVAVYFFYRHNTYCEPGVYTIFAGLEYSIILSNIAFHATAAVDFGAGKLEFTNAERDKLL